MNENTKDYLIVCDNMEAVNKLMESFIIVIKSRELLKYCSRYNKTVYLYDGTRYKFTDIKHKELFSKGFRGIIISELTFKDMINKFKK